jgi:hypothetical protein
VQARELVLGRHGTPIQVQVLRQAMGAGMRGSGQQAVFQPLAYVLYRGVNTTRAPAGAPAAMGSRGSSSVRTPSPFRPSPGAPTSAVALQQRPFGVNEHMCGIGVFIERVRGSLVVKSINPNGPAGQVPPTYLFPGDGPTVTALNSVPINLRKKLKVLLLSCLRCTQLLCVAPSHLVHGAGDHLVAIDGKNTQTMTMQEVRFRLLFSDVDVSFHGPLIGLHLHSYLRT